MTKNFLFSACVLINIIFSLVLLSPLSRADEMAPPERIFKGAISGFIETGKRSTAEDYEEEDNDADYTYSRYQFKFKQELPERAGYCLSSFRYIKDYDNSDNLDNKSQIFKSNWFYYISKRKENSLKFDVNLQYKTKGYYDSPEREFNQLTVMPSLKFKKEDIYALNFTAGFNKYDYLTAEQNSQLKYSAMLDGYRYFLEKKLMFSGSYGLEHLNHKETGRDREKHNFTSGIGYIFDYNFIYKIEAQMKWGKRDTKDDEERDDDSDYEYRQYKLKTVHKISAKLKTDLSYDYFKKSYNTIDLGHRGFYVANGYDYEIMDDNKQKAWMNFGLGRKNTRYSERTRNDYKKITAGIRLNYNRKKNWKTSLGLEGDFYKYSDEADNKKRYYTELSAEKLLFKEKLNVNMDVKYRLTDYSQKLDDEQAAVRLSIGHEF